uniref:RNA-directed DNA polymerase n=1 Tax=Trichuris muris TaxID=70415 RepID=A0A5S6QT12_TRIMR
MNREQIILAQQRFSFDAFDPAEEEWSFYIQRFERELALFGLRDGKETENTRRTLLLSKIGKKHFQTLVNHFRPNDVRDQTYEKLKAVLQSQYGRQPCVMADRVAFAQRFRQENETVSQFLNALRGLAANCEFGDSLTERLRDQLVIGINNATWREQLLRYHADNRATLQEVEQTATTLECAHRQNQLLLSQPGDTESLATRRLQVQPRSKLKSEESERKRVLDASKHCLQCGRRKHVSNERCIAEGKNCYECGKKNHFAVVCMIKGRARLRRKGPQRVNALGIYGNRVASPDSSEASDKEMSLNSISAVGPSCHKAIVPVKINHERLEMIYDPGATQSVISEQMWHTLGKPPLQAAPALVAYTDVPVETLGKTKVQVTAFGKTMRLHVHVVKKTDAPLFGLNWCMAFGLPLPQGIEIRSLRSETCDQGQSELPSRQEEVAQNLIKLYPDVFTNTAGTILGHEAEVHLREEVRPKLFKPRPVPFALKAQIYTELNRLLNDDVLEQVDPATMPIEWASPIVCVVKPSGKVRICGDFKVTINPHVILDHHPLPRFEELIAKLNGGTLFSVIDLKDAYLQMRVHPDSRKYLVIATHRGYFRYKRLPFGLSFAPALFQKTMEQILAGIDGVAIYIDDIIITGCNVQQHMDRLHTVLKRLRKAGVHTCASKCKFMCKSVTYLGHRIDQEGIHPTQERIEAIRQMPMPSNVQELRSFLGAVNYYAKFVPGLQQHCVPLYRLTKSGIPWAWGTEETRLVERLKRMLTSSETLVHYDEKRPLILATDACEIGVGAVLSNLFPSGGEVYRICLPNSY